MTTDQTQTGIPSATRGRMQLVKPQQVNNSGLNSPLKNFQNNVSNITSEKYNPIMAKGQSESPNPLQTPSVAPTPSTTHKSVTTDAQGYNSKYGYDTGVTDSKTGENLFYNPSLVNNRGAMATPSYQDLVEDLGNQFSNLTEDQQIRFLNNIANGIYKSNGMQTSATMTGEPNETNTVGTRIQNLGQR